MQIEKLQVGCVGAVCKLRCHKTCYRRRQRRENQSYEKYKHQYSKLKQRRFVFKKTFHKNNIKKTTSARKKQTKVVDIE